MSDENESESEVVESGVSLPNRMPRNRVREWSAGEIEKYYLSKARAAAEREGGWVAALFIDGEPATDDILHSSPPGSDVAVCVGKAGSSATVTQAFILAEPRSAVVSSEVPATLKEVNALIPALVQVIERVTAQHIKVVESSAAMAKLVRKSLRRELKGEKKRIRAEATTAAEIAKEDKGISRVIETLGEKLGKEGLERLLTTGIADLISFVDKRVPTSATPPVPSQSPAPPQRPKSKNRRGKKGV